MKILDLDMDYFMTVIAGWIPDSSSERLSEKDYGDSVWKKDSVREFLENNLGLSKDKKIKGRVISGHNEALFFWRELIKRGDLTAPFEVVHVDSHADLGLGYSSWTHILHNILQHPACERPLHNQYKDCFGNVRGEGIGDYLLFAIAYQWISKITYCANPNGGKDDYLWCTLKNFHENYVGKRPVENIIQLVCSPEMEFPHYYDSTEVKKRYLDLGKKEPEVPLLIIPTIEDVNFDGEFDFAVMAQSPNYTPESADFIIDIFREYILEC